MKARDDRPVSTWLRLLPAAARTRIEHRPNLLRILTNIAWLFSDKILRMGVGVVVGVWLARHLGPDRFGSLSFTIAFVAMFSTVALMGQRDIVVRDVVNEPTRDGEILASAFFMLLAGGSVALLVMFGTISVLRADDTLVKMMVAIVGCSLVCRASDVIKYWFSSQVLSKYSVWVENSAFLLASGTKLLLIQIDAPLIAFAWVLFVEALIVAVALFVVYAWRGGRLARWRPTWSRAKNLLRQGWPLILSGLAMTVYLKIDQIMIGQFLDDRHVGIYAAAARISEVWYFFPGSIVASVFPAIIEARKKSAALFRARFLNLYRLMILISLVVALPMTFLSGKIVPLIFGPEYVAAGPILSIHIWAGVFFSLGAASTKWYIVEHRQTLLLQRSLLGAVTNVVLNLVLIPLCGNVGAAIATVVSYSMAGLFFDALTRSTRPVFFMKLRAFLPWRRSSEVEK